MKEDSIPRLPSTIDYCLFNYCLLYKSRSAAASVFPAGTLYKALGLWYNDEKRRIKGGCVL